MQILMPSFTVETKGAPLDSSPIEKRWEISGVSSRKSTLYEEGHRWKKREHLASLPQFGLQEVDRSNVILHSEGQGRPLTQELGCGHLCGTPEADND